MKTTLFCLCLLAGSAAAAPYYLPSPQPGALTDADWQPTNRLEGLYAIGASHTPDTAGFRLGQSLYSPADSSIRHEFSLQIAPQWGSGHRTRHEHRSHQDIFLAPLTGGYTLNLGITEDIYLCLGGKAGWAFGHYKEKSSVCKESGYVNGFTFSAGGGLKIRCSERLYAQLGYEFGRTYTNNRHDDTLGQHIITAGLGWQF